MSVESRRVKMMNNLSVYLCEAYKIMNNLSVDLCEAYKIMNNLSIDLCEEYKMMKNLSVDLCEEYKMMNNFSCLEKKDYFAIHGMMMDPPDAQIDTRADVIIPNC